MTCKLYQTELSAYLDGELPVTRRGWKPICGSVRTARASCKS